MTVARPAFLLALLACAPGLTAQTFQATVLPDSATVGDLVQVVVRFVVAQDARVAYPDSLPVSGSLENAARPRLAVDTVEEGLAFTAVYAVAPWEPGRAELPELEVQLLIPGGGMQAERIALPGFEVVSVLPQDTTGLEAKPPRGVLGASWLLWPYLLLLLALTAAAIAAWAWYRRRRPPPPVTPLVPARPPRERALEALERARQLGLVEARRFKAFYSLVAEALRHYAAALDPLWGEDLTTTELVARMQGSAPVEDVRVLGSLLRAADLVKFARHVPERAEAGETWDRARDWVEGYPPATLPRKEAA